MNPRSFGGQIPVPGQDATQSELLFFAITYNGYNRIKGGVPAVANLANPVIDKFKKEKTLPEDLNLLRLTLFWLQRSGHNQEQMDGSSWSRSESIWHAIVDKIREVSGGYVEKDDF